MSATPISRKKITVTKESRGYRWSPDRAYSASYGDEGQIAFGATAEHAREEAVRQLVLTKRYIDPRPASKGGAR